MEKHVVVAPALRRASLISCRFDGLLGHYLRATTENWLLTAPRANPGMLEMFRERDRLPMRLMVPWAGEFAGKYLTSAVEVYSITRDKRLRETIETFVAELVRLQGRDGYLGPWPGKYRLAGRAPNVGGDPQKEPWKSFGHLIDKSDSTAATWDAWGHYHLMLGLLDWHDLSGDAKALRAAMKIGDLFCRKFLGRERSRLVDTGSTEMNLAPIHSLGLMYRKTGRRRYLDLAMQIADDEFAAKDQRGHALAGNYLLATLDEGKEFFQTPKPRWESLHPVMGLAELYWITGRDEFRRAFERIWWSIVKLDRHNNGGFSSGEQAQGNPYHAPDPRTGLGGAMETCCTVAWIAMSVEMLKLTGNSIVADELELSTLNFVTGYHSYSGRWVTYDTPMDGVRKASAHQIVFQSREGTPELNCCSVNGPRGLGMVGEWALMRGNDDDGDSLIVNWYGPSTIAVDKFRRGASVTLRQETDYPRGDTINLLVEPSRAMRFTLKLRIPHWSRRTGVAVNGRPLRSTVTPGSYLALDRLWKRGDRVRIKLDLSLHYWRGERDCAGKTSVYRGPILLTYDRRFNEIDPHELPALDARALKGRLVQWRGGGISSPPWLLVEFTSARDGRRVRLCDFGSAGECGSPYRSWLDVRSAPATPEFTQLNPLRSARVRWNV